MTRILIVDDDYSIRSMFQFLFLDEGYEVKLASNGKAALDCLSNFVPDLMLIDLHMPIMTGYDFIKTLNKSALNRPELKDIPYVILSGNTVTEAEKNLMLQKNKSCKLFLPKTTEHGVVLALVKKILKKKSEFAISPHLKKWIFR